MCLGPAEGGTNARRGWGATPPDVAIFLTFASAGLNSILGDFVRGARRGLVGWIVQEVEQVQQVQEVPLWPGAARPPAHAVHFGFFFGVSVTIL